MNRFLISVLALSLSMATAFAGLPSPRQVILERKSSSGSRRVFEDLTVSNDGTVVRTLNGVTQTLKSLSPEEIAGIEKLIAAIQEGELNRTAPGQFYNPGGFVREYLYIAADGHSFEFARNVSGIDFGLPNSQGQDLVQLLDQLK